MTAELNPLSRRYGTVQRQTLKARPTIAEAASLGLGLLTKLGAALLAVGVVFTTAAQAGTVTITFEEVGSNVQATISGSLALTGLEYQFDEFIDPAFVDPSGPAFYSPTFSVFLQENVDRWVAFSVAGPESFGSGDRTSATSLSGDPFAFEVYNFEEGSFAELWLPVGYAANQALSGTTTWNNTTFAGLGITPGTYTWTLGGTDSVVIQAVPEPATCMMALAGLGFAGYSMFRRRKRA
jgi:hypothetical protein